MNTIKKVLVIGSGPIVIGQAAEFDYAGTEACLALKAEGIEVVLLNNNPATIMTDESVADSIYMEPMTVATIEEIFKKEQPDGMIGTLGGQTGLNLTFAVNQAGLLEKYHVQLLGTTIESIQNGEDRDLFRKLMQEMDEPVPESHIAATMEQALGHAAEIGYPVIVRPAYTLGGTGGGFAENEQDLKKIVTNGLNVSPIHQVLLEKSIKGFREVEFEVIRDVHEDCVIVCSMENIDPVGVHTGDSIVVAPAQTLTQKQDAMLKDAAVRIVRELGVIGACNIQFALAHDSDQYFVIEVNPRVSRSSALASKATGCPIAVIATKCALLDSLDNYFPEKTASVHDLTIDYTVVKMPRFSFDKFPEADRKLGTQMKATGEIMAIDQTVEAALNKAIRSLDNGLISLSHPILSGKDPEVLMEHMKRPTDLYLFAVAESMRQGKSVKELHEDTAISQPFLEEIKQIVLMEETLKKEFIQTITTEKLLQAKQMQISDKALSVFLQTTEEKVRQKIKECGLEPSYLSIGSVNQSAYYYSTWTGPASSTITENKNKSVLIIGSGPIRIGQGMEFDYSSVHAVYALKKLGYKTIVINNNPETVSTDSSVADHLYFEPLTVEDILNVIDKENVEGVMIQFGGQTALNLAKELEDAGISIYGTTPERIDQLEDRDQFYQLLNELNVPHIAGGMVYSLDEIKTSAKKIGYPVLVRPSYVIGGQSMQIVYQEETLTEYVKTLMDANERIWPVLIDQYTPGMEVELDLISDGENISVPAIMEHVEKAGVHSGDSIAVMPPVNLSDEQQERLLQYAEAICKQAGIIGFVNIQYIVTNEQIYVLEVNPRASRTVPLISKVTGVAMVESAIRVQLGEKLSKTGLLEAIDFYAVKAPVFSAPQLVGVDPVLGPVMKSTGEAIGIAKTYPDALAKATYLSAMLKKSTTNGSILCSIADREKQEMLPVIKKLSNDFSILATPGTSVFLTKNGVANQKVDDDSETLINLFQQKNVAGAVVIPSGLSTKKHGKEIRTLAIMYQVALFTCKETVEVATGCLECSPVSVKSLQDYQNAEVHHDFTEVHKQNAEVHNQIARSSQYSR